MSGHLREHRDNRFQQFYPAGVVRLGHHLDDSHRVERGGGLHRGATSVRVEPSLIDGRPTAGAFGDVSMGRSPMISSATARSTSMSKVAFTFKFRSTSTLS